MAIYHLLRIIIVYFVYLYLHMYLIFKTRYGVLLRYGIENDLEYKSVLKKICS